MVEKKLQRRDEDNDDRGVGGREQSVVVGLLSAEKHEWPGMRLTQADKRLGEIQEGGAAGKFRRST